MQRKASHEGQERKRPAIGKVGHGLPSAKCGEAPSAALLQGIAEFNEQLFFQQHETLEGAWIEETDPIRYLYQGILQVGVAFHHLGRANFRGADNLLRRGIGYLRPFLPSCMGVDVERLIADAERAHAELTALGPARIAEFERSRLPQVHLVGEAAHD